MTINSPQLLSKMSARRRDFHAYPETGWAEFRTTAKIAEIIDSLGFNIKFGGNFILPETVMGLTTDPKKEMERAVKQGANPKWVEKTGGYTGLSAEIDTGRPGPTLALRFDIDCVDVVEADDEDHLPAREGFRSHNHGCMHACGHDGHTTIGLSVAEFVAENKDSLTGKIRLLFQPAEEGVRGGYAMTQSGLLDDVDYFIALHLGLGLPTGTVSGGTKGFLCTTKFDAEFTGKGAHAGGEPNEGKNALLAAASAALNLHAIAPHRDGPTRVNVGVLTAGEGRNVVPPSAYMKIETRGLTEEILKYVYDRSVQVITGAAAMYDCKVQIFKRGESISTYSDPEIVKIICDAARQTEGVNCVKEIMQMTGSDDACWMMKRVQDHGGKATYVGLGATIAAGHHNSRFDFDEACMPIGYGVLTRAITAILGKK